VDKDFYERIFDVVRLIPKGKVTTYGHIARCLGSGRSSRLVGYAMNSSHKHDPLIPAHRVVNRKGLLTGKMHFKDVDEMQRLLEKEGIEVKNDQILNFQHHLWDPSVLGDEL
jgi:methylated-DNA-protein-cysteine methyltransferase-like protein